MQCNSGWGYWNEDREEAWKRSREMLSRLADKAVELGLHLVMESLRPQESQLVTTLAEFDYFEDPRSIDAGNMAQYSEYFI